MKVLQIAIVTCILL